MTPKQLREWLFKNSQDDQWWISLDAVTEDCAVTVNDIEERLKSGQYGQAQVLHVSQTELTNPPWIEVELPAPTPQRTFSAPPRVEPFPSKTSIPVSSSSNTPSQPKGREGPAFILSLIRGISIAVAVICIFLGFLFPPAWILAVVCLVVVVSIMLISPAQPSKSQQETLSGGRVFGLLLLVIGLGAVGFFLLFFDTSVSTEYGSVNNLGLMSDRQNGIIVGGILAVVGVLLGMTGRK
jgi:hypothetical protein